MTKMHVFAATNHAAWTKPAVRKIRAGDAENSPTPVRADGRFSSGQS